AEMKDVVNTKIKFREPFRPFAPAVTETATPAYFPTRASPDDYPARFMLVVHPIEPDRRPDIPAVTHMGTGRLQTVRREWNPFYYDVIDTFGRATGVPVVLNTSFNLRGEPMVASPEDAYRSFRASEI